MADYVLNLFNKDFLDTFKNKSTKINQLTKEEFLRFHAQNILMQLWQNFDEAILPKDMFHKDFTTQLNNNTKTLSALYKTLFKKSDPFFLKAARIEVQQTLLRLQANLDANPPETDEQQLKIELAISNILSIFVMFEPSPFETIIIPQCINQKWQLIEFAIEPIELTPTNGFWSVFLKDTSRLFSYGFTAKNAPLASRILASKGTGWFTAQGVSLQIIADLYPNKTPGEIFFEWQSEQINQWLDSASTKVTTLGQSLGGSISYLLAMHRPDKINKAICHVPPGMSQAYAKDHWLFGKWQQTAPVDRPQVIIQKQTFDPISKCGIFPDDFELVSIRPTQEKINSTPFRLIGAHARNFAAFDGVEIKHINMQTENKCPNRQANNYWLYDNRALIFNSLILPSFFILSPLISFFKNNAFILSTTALAFVGCILLPPVASIALSLPFILNFHNLYLSYLVASYALSFLFETFIKLSYELSVNHFQGMASYCKTISTMPLADAVWKLAFDTLNILCLNSLNIMSNLIDSIGDIISKLLCNNKSTPAHIHTFKHFELTKDLNAYSEPSINDKLEILGLLIIFYSIATPIKLICIDLPNYLWTCANSLTTSAETKTAYIKSPSTNWASWFYSKEQQDLGECKTFNLYASLI